MTLNRSDSVRLLLSPSMSVEDLQKLRTQALHLTLTAILQIEGKDSARAIRTFDRDIRVQVTWSQRISGFAGENWQWLWTTVAVPIALWVWGKRRKKQRR